MMQRRAIMFRSEGKVINKQNLLQEENNYIARPKILSELVQTSSSDKTEKREDCNSELDHRNKTCSGKRRLLRYGRVLPGTYVDSETIFDPIGVRFSLSQQGNVQGGPNDGDPKRLMVFDSESQTYTGYSQDLINFIVQIGHVLIISNNNMGSAQGDHEMFLEQSLDGGLITIIFSQQVRIKSVDFLSAQGSNYIITYKDTAGTHVDTQVQIPDQGSGTHQTVDVNSRKIVRMDIDLGGSGAIGPIRYRECESHCGPTDVLDCNGVCGGSAVYDCKGRCYDPKIGEMPKYLRDCSGHCYDVKRGPVFLPDCNGDCFDPRVQMSKFTKDCAGMCYKAEENPPHEEDCRGVCGGNAFENCYGECVVSHNKHNNHHNHNNHRSYSGNSDHSDHSYSSNSEHSYRNNSFDHSYRNNSSNSDRPNYSSDYSYSSDSDSSYSGRPRKNNIYNNDHSNYSNYNDYIYDNEPNEDERSTRKSTKKSARKKIISREKQNWYASKYDH